MSLIWPTPKDPSDVVWYQVNCVGLLGGDTLATAVFSVPDGLTKEAESFTTTEARVKLSGGTADTTYPVMLDVTTAGGQTFQRTITLKVQQQ